LFLAFKILKSTSKRWKNDKVSKIFFRKSRFFTNIFTETPITRSFFNIFSIRFFQCILQVLVHLYWCAKVFYDPSFRRVVKKKNRFRPKTAFFTQLLSRHALTIHFTDTPLLSKYLAFVLPIPTLPLNFLYHASGLRYGLNYSFPQFSPFSRKNLNWKLKYWQKILEMNNFNLLLEHYVKLLE